MELTDRQLLILSIIARAESHTERHCSWVIAELGTPVDQRSYEAVGAEIYALDKLGLVGTDLCGCDETAGYGINDAGYEALKAAGYCEACWGNSCNCKQCGAPCSTQCGDDTANMQACGGGFGGSDG